jgi:phosphotransacetylase
MSIFNTVGSAKQVSQNATQGQPAGYHPSMAELFRLRQMERILQQTTEELEQVKARLSQLEKALAKRGEIDVAVCGNVQSGSESSTPPLPIAEMKQLADMAKRFR